MLARARDDYGSWLMNRVWRLRHRCFFAGFCTRTWLSASMVDMMHADDRATVHRCLKCARA